MDIEIIVNDKLLVLVGNEKGQEIFESQVLPKIDTDSNKKYKIIFPDHIIGIASSIPRGFLNWFIKENNIKWYQKHICIGGNKEIVDKFDCILSECVYAN